LAGTSLRPNLDVGCDTIERSVELNLDVGRKRVETRVPTIRPIEQGHVLFKKICEHHRMVHLHLLITAVSTRFYLPCVTGRSAKRVLKRY